LTAGHPLTLWERWVRQPQRVWLRRAIFQAHLWSGIILGLYIFLMSVTGSVLVYRNELYRAATPDRIFLNGSGPRLTDGQLAAAARRVYPGFTVTKITPGFTVNQPVEVSLSRGNKIKKRLFDQWSGRDLRDSVPLGIWLVSRLLDLHDNLLAGQTGLTVNGVGAFALLALAMTGTAIWWPGIRTWRRSLTLHRGLGWRRWTWHAHSMIGFWSLGFTLVFGISGVYLCFPQPFQDFADWLEPLTAANGGLRIVDKITYWIAFLHFGRINGIGIPCSGPGVCDQATKAVWALFGIAPAAMFVTGAIMWWNRVLRPRLARMALPRVAESGVAGEYRAGQ
jgi:uncharacterized iron-regulated membrane protein